MVVSTGKGLMVRWDGLCFTYGRRIDRMQHFRVTQTGFKSENESLVVGFMQVEPKGPIFRLHQEEPCIRFFDIRNIQTEEWRRIPISEKATRFVTRLLPGQYEVFRIQIGEGPFQSEAYLNLNFDVYANKTVYLGIWRMQVDSPKTVRMLQLDVFDELPDWDLLVALHPELDEKVLAVSLPQPMANHTRLFAVASAQPRAKYFYRR